MYKIKQNEIGVCDVATYLNTKIHFFEEFYISHPSSPDMAKSNSIVFLEHCTRASLNSLPKDCLLLTQVFETEEFKVNEVNPAIIFTDTPELDFYRVVSEFFVQESIFSIHPSAVLDNSVKLGVNVNVGQGSYLAAGVSVGSNTYIGRNVIIHEGNHIGTNCHIKDGAIIGSESFKFVEDDRHLSMTPFFGHIVIEDNVWIGANVILERPAFDAHTIGENVKIDDLVQVGADVSIGANVQIAAGTIVGRNVSIGCQCKLGINTVIKPNVKIGQQVSTGIGSVVISDLGSSSVYVGNPAKLLRAD
ncbi:hypothetical protein FM038_016035 [Shewanella eurypsychrophilus]|uniref:UDP-3-O-(3-hydroxymyristoyl)glucosamine N-acyltransferase n=1 Tax=Shewanella eurypsychrophilus TaxID=2593656 RepID=A0ABX6VA61_9GAMM|nr:MULTISPECIES: DapH/DapD/GlmU-related protein [Shewanella]QFU23532.1 hypothetical protein FS418_17835 [Shewanella sp. YLB-09]QPG58758.1 hypothetical protein FM038_016035 [Shewanella eurypsychrophilus]